MATRLAQKLCAGTYIYIARIPSRIPSLLHIRFRENTYIYDAHTLAHTRALMCTKVYIYSAHTLAHTRFAQACFSRPLGGNRFAGYAIPLGRAYPAHTQKCVFKGLEGPLALERAAKRYICGSRKSSTPLGNAKK